MKEEDDKAPVKRIHIVDGIVFVRLDDSVIRTLSLDRDEVWVEQYIVEEGVLLKIKRRVNPKNINAGGG